MTSKLVKFMSEVALNFSLLHGSLEKVRATYDKSLTKFEVIWWYTHWTSSVPMESLPVLKTFHLFAHITSYISNTLKVSAKLNRSTFALGNRKQAWCFKLCWPMLICVSNWGCKYCNRPLTDATRDIFIKGQTIVAETLMAIFMSLTSSVATNVRKSSTWIRNFTEKQSRKSERNLLGYFTS